MKIQMKVL